MNECWLRRDELQSLSGWSKRTIQAKVKHGSLIARAGDKRERNGRFAQLYAFSSLPPKLQAAFLRNRPQSSELAIIPSSTSLIGCAGSELLRTSAEATRHILTDDQLEEAERIFGQIKPLIDYLNATKEQRALILNARGIPFSNSEEVARSIASSIGKSVATVWRWRADFMKSGLPGLIAKPRSDKGKSRWMERNPEAKFIIAAEFLNAGRSVQAAYDALVRWWRDQARAEALLPGYETVRTWLDSFEVPAPLKVLAREGERRHNERMMPYIRRKYTDVEANQIWVSDHMLHDVLVRNDCFLGIAEDAQMRLRLTAWLDMRTRKVVGNCWTPEGSSRSIVTAYRLGALRWGNPLQVLTDNGRDYIKATKAGRFTRGDAITGWSEDSEWLAQGALYRLGVKVQHCLPYHPQSKHIERFFRTLHIRLDSIFPHYLTGNAYNRPDQASDALAEHRKLLVMGRGKDSKLMPASEFIAMAKNWIESDYNNHPHRGEGMDGLSPNQLFDELYPPEKRRQADPSVLDQLLWERAQRRVDSCAVTFGGRGSEKRRYLPADRESAAKMYVANETDVIICFDPNSPSEAIATTLDGVKIADLKAEQLAPHSEEAAPMIAESMQQRRQLRNAMKDTERHIKRKAHELGSKSSFEDLHERSMLPAAIGGLLSQRVSKRPQPDNNAVAPPTAGQIADDIWKRVQTQ
jgi:putative transposase